MFLSIILIIVTLIGHRHCSHFDHQNIRTTAATKTKLSQNKSTVSRSITSRLLSNLCCFKNPVTLEDNDPSNTLSTKKSTQFAGKHSLNVQVDNVRSQTVTQQHATITPLFTKYAQQNTRDLFARESSPRRRIHNKYQVQAWELDPHRSPIAKAKRVQATVKGMTFIEYQQFMLLIEKSDTESISNYAKKVQKFQRLMHNLFAELTIIGDMHYVEQDGTVSFTINVPTVDSVNNYDPIVTETHVTATYTSLCVFTEHDHDVVKNMNHSVIYKFENKNTLFADDANFAYSMIADYFVDAIWLGPSMSSDIKQLIQCIAGIRSFAKNHDVLIIVFIPLDRGLNDLRAFDQELHHVMENRRFNAKPIAIVPTQYRRNTEP